jgi:GNAT superfamily N-acetyltransferase
VTDALRLDRDRDLGGEALRAAVERRLAYLACPGRRGGGVVAYRRDLAVGHGAWRDGTDGASVYLAGAVTLRPHRRSGVYTAILGWRLDRAAQAGRTVAVAVAERATSAPILMRKGFREVGGRQIWVAL